MSAALVSTPQSHHGLGALEGTTGWNADQFVRLFDRRSKPLPETTERADLLAIVAREWSERQVRCLSLTSYWIGAPEPEFRARLRRPQP